MDSAIYEEAFFLSFCPTLIFIFFAPIIFHFKNIHRRQEMWPWQLFSSSSVGTNFCLLPPNFLLTFTFFLSPVCDFTFFSSFCLNNSFSSHGTAWNVFIKHVCITKPTFVSSLPTLFSLSIFPFAQLEFKT